MVPIDFRMFQHFDQYNYMKMAQENELRNILQQSVESLRARERRGHQLVADSGYGSRVGAGANFAIAQMARNGIFSIHGPGRKKRSYHDNVNDILRS
ncbi:hypothetical protein DPMN_033905 [Dreissena polymorpha]|uniref:Uncharacterized protein n=1 Tax=Dreissena polymorpha TaxID=45954 RepID=A0A9D4M5R4_DREPO|nr:hypothetical protein DPMN_033905 [Dreissena polymorpha]